MKGARARVEPELGREVPLAVVIWIGAYALVFGALLVTLGVRLRSRGRSSIREPPPGAVPVTR